MLQKIIRQEYISEKFIFLMACLSYLFIEDIIILFPSLKHFCIRSNYIVSIGAPKITDRFFT